MTGPSARMSDCVSTMILLLLCAGISATLRGPSPQTLLVPHGVNATVKFTCSDGSLSEAVARVWLWTILNKTYSSSQGVSIVSVVNSASDSNDESDAQSILTISSVDDIIQSPIGSINVTCKRRLTFISGPNQDNSSTATLVTFGPLQQPTVSHNTSSVLVQWMPPLLRYNLHYRLVIYPSNNTTLCLNSTSNSTEYTVDPSALGDGCSTVNCTMYRVTVTAMGNGEEGQPATSEPFIFPTGTVNI